jgi:hypothetical protein
MKPADKAFLDGLRKSVCVDVPQDHWDLVCKAVDDAGDIRNVTGYARTIILEGVEKGRFASRSEAGRYAANMRWRGSVPQGGLATAEARQEANAKAGLGAGNPARGGGKGFDSPKMKEQLAYEAKRDQALGAKAADIADAVSEKDEPVTPKAGTPGPNFDSRSGYKGSKYQGYRPVKQVAIDVRRDLKDAVANGELPQGLKFSVKSDNRGTNAVRVRVSGMPKTRDDYGRLTGEAKAVYDKVDSIVNAYNRDNSDIMTDYFDVDYYGTVQLDD